MKWVTDKTGRFQKRPHYLPDELDHECERIVGDFLHSTHGGISYPISTDDLTVLMESRVGDLDLYADLSREGGDVEGVTDFYTGRQPEVRISKKLTSGNHFDHRLRTTLTHELGHVVFHSFMFDENSRTGALFGGPSQVVSNKCKRDNILEASHKDWMEWQAGYACGAFLMPVTALRGVVREFLEVHRISVGRFASRSHHGQLLISRVNEHFSVSRDAARVRLSQLGTLQGGEQNQVLF